MGPTGNLPPGVFSVNFVVQENPGPTWAIGYDLSTTENMVVSITTKDTAATSSQPGQGQTGTFAPGESGIPVPANQNVNGSFSATAGVYNIYLQQTAPITGPTVEVWTGLAVPPAVTSEGGGEDGLGFGYGQGFPPGHHVYWRDNLPVGEPVARQQ